MTYNQIAHAANVETNRHNLALEENDRRRVDVQAEQVEADKWYKQESLRITEEYNSKNLELQQAQGDRKLQIQEDLAWLEWKKQQLDANYRQQSLDIQSRHEDTLQAQQAETERYQKALNDLGYSQQEINAQLANVQERLADYKKYETENQIRIQDMQALMRKQQIDNEYSLGLIRAELEETRNEMTNEMNQYGKANIFLSNVWEGFKTIGSFIKPSIRIGG